MRLGFTTETDVQCKNAEQSVDLFLFLSDVIPLSLCCFMRTAFSVSTLCLHFITLMTCPNTSRSSHLQRGVAAGFVIAPSV